MAPTTKKANDIFFTTFLGEYVEIVCRYETDSEGKMVIQGYFLDMDDSYYFIGSNHIEISAAIKKEDVSLVNIVNKVDPNVELLENMPIPEDDIENN